jgi:hypothetical protein
MTFSVEGIWFIFLLGEPVPGVCDGVYSGSKQEMNPTWLTGSQFVFHLICL